MVKAVIFDMDGVLIDTEKWLNKYWRQAAAEAGYDMTVGDGLAIRSLAAKVCGAVSTGAVWSGFPVLDDPRAAQGTDEGAHRGERDR